MARSSQRDARSSSLQRMVSTPPTLRAGQWQKELALFLERFVITPDRSKAYIIRRPGFQLLRRSFCVDKLPTNETSIDPRKDRATL